MLKKIKLAILALLWTSSGVWAQSMPQISLGVDYSDQYDMVIDPRYANVLTDNTAFGFEIAFGSKEFRLAGTWAGLFNCRHLVKVTGEYLSQNTNFIFDQIVLPLWDEQSAFGVSYSLLNHGYGITSYNFGLYEVQARDENLIPRTFLTPQYTIFRDVSGSSVYGGFVGVTLQPWLYTRLTSSVYYDDVLYHNDFESKPNRQGVGAGVCLEQILHPRFLLSIEASDRKLYRHCGVKASWLIPIPTCAKLELALKGERVTGNLVNPEENRVGIMLTYRWNLPDYNPNYLMSKTIEETALIATTKPVIRMPQVFATRDEHRESLP